MTDSAHIVNLDDYRRRSAKPPRRPKPWDEAEVVRSMEGCGCWVRQWTEQVKDSFSAPEWTTETCEVAGDHHPTCPLRYPPDPPA